MASFGFSGVEISCSTTKPLINYPKKSEHKI
jgi:hypothetical protein